VDWGDSSTHGTASKASTGTLGSMSHTYADDGTYTVTVKVTDKNDGVDSKTFQVNVSNVAPTTTLTSPATAAVEGQTKTYTYTVSDPGNDTYTTTESCGANGTYTNTAAANSFDCTFPEGPASSTVSVQATDSDNLAGNTASTSVAVSNANPVVGALSVTDPKSGVSCLGGNTVNLSSSFTDAGSLDTHSATIDWGDGNTTTGTVNSATRTVTGQHAYSGLGPYTIKVTVTDNDGGVGYKSSTNSLSFHYNIGTKLLSPVNDTTVAGSTPSLFKLGSTIPLKVNITDCNGVGVAGLSPTIKMMLTSSSTPLAGEDEGISTQPNDSNFVMRGDGSGQYIYNLASKSLPDSSATYKAQITDHGYTVTTQNYFGLKAK
jgi:hypothetical protein